MEATTLREHATDAIRYWEPRRILYNAILAAVVVAYFVVSLPVSKNALTLDGLLFLFLLAVRNSRKAGATLSRSKRRGDGLDTAALAFAVS